MKTTVREQKIISLLESRGEMSVNELSAILDVSVSALRKQLADMQNRKLIIRTYGGVMSINPVPAESFDSKLHKSVSETYSHRGKGSYKRREFDFSWQRYDRFRPEQPAG